MIETVAMAVFLLAALWLFGGLIGSHARSDVRSQMTRRFRMVGGAIVVCSFGVGLLYHYHVIPLVMAAILYIPVVVTFIWGMKWLQPYLRSEPTDFQ